MYFKSVNDIWYFQDKYCKNISPEERENIKVLEDESSSQLWCQYVSDRHRHLMLVKNEEWKLTEVQSLPYNWTDDWNNDVLDAFSKNIASM